MNILMAWSAFMVVALGSGCGVTPMFNPPIVVDPTPEQRKVVESQHVEIAQKLVGDWKAGDEAEAKAALGEKNLLMLDVQLKEGDKGMKQVPLYGLCSYLNNEPYLTFCVNLNQPAYDGINGMVRPNFYAAHLVFDGADNVTVEIITWKTEGENGKPTDPSLVFCSNGDAEKCGDTVMNSSEELCKLIAAGKYRVAKTY
ncbi:MAG: hypothetical protein AB7F40_10955, partial [Victivallaceae bacterium]